MAILKISLLFVLTAIVAADDSCPASNEISPCTCDGEGFNCMGARTLDEVRKAFRAKFRYGGVRSVWIQGTPITSIQRDLFNNVKSESFFIEVNDISFVDLNAFSASKKILKTLSLFGNKLNSTDYSALTNYEALGILNLGRNEITSIPDNAFNSKSLHTLILSQNMISHVGMNAFANLQNIGLIRMSNNQLKTLGPMSFASKIHAPHLQVHLDGNKISSVSSSAFHGLSPQIMNLAYNQLTSLPPSSFSNLIARMGNNRGRLYIISNPLTCTGCDYSWIVDNKHVLPQVIEGFTCKNGKSISDLTKSGINCFSVLR